MTAKNIYVQDAFPISTTNELFETTQRAVQMKWNVEMRLINFGIVVDFGKSSAADD